MIAITLPLSGRAHCLVSELPAFVDEVVFHQLLHWHHFYDKSTTDVGLVSDACSMLSGGLRWYPACSVQHKLMRLHQIRYEVAITPYDITWHVIAVMLIIAGIVVLFVRPGPPSSRDT